MFKPLIACFLLWVFFQATLTDKARVKIRIVKEVSVNRQLISAICGKYQMMAEMCDLKDTNLGEFLDKFN